MFKPINKWPKYHLRNMAIALNVAHGNTYKSVGDLYGISGNRVMQIYRIFMSKLCARIFNIPFKEAINDKKYYYHPDRLNMILNYKKDYIYWIENIENRSSDGNAQA